MKLFYIFLIQKFNIIERFDKLLILAKYFDVPVEYFAEEETKKEGE